MGIGFGFGFGFGSGLGFGFSEAALEHAAAQVLPACPASRPQEVKGDIQLLRAVELCLIG